MLDLPLSKFGILDYYYNGNTKFSPIHVSDLVDIILNTIENKNNNLDLECVGPEILTFKEIIQKLLKLTGKKRILLLASSRKLFPQLLVLLLC